MTGAPLLDTFHYRAGTIYPAPEVGTAVPGGSPNSTGAFFHQSTLPFFTKPLAHIGNRSLIIYTARKIVIFRLSKNL